MAEALSQWAPEPPTERHTDLDPYYANTGTGGVRPYPICGTASRSEWLVDLDNFMERRLVLYNDPFFPDVAEPLFRAWTAFKQLKGKKERIAAATQEVEECLALDWRKATMEWLRRRSQG